MDNSVFKYDFSLESIKELANNKDDIDLLCNSLNSLSTFHKGREHIGIWHTLMLAQNLITYYAHYEDKEVGK